MKPQQRWGDHTTGPGHRREQSAPAAARGPAALGPGTKGPSCRSYRGGRLICCSFSPRETEQGPHAGSPSHRRPTQKPNIGKISQPIKGRDTTNSYRRAIERGCRIVDVPVMVVVQAAAHCRHLRLQGVRPRGRPTDPRPCTGGRDLELRKKTVAISAKVMVKQGPHSPKWSNLG